MKQTVTISQNMGCEKSTVRIPNISFLTGNKRPTFNNQLIKKKEFKSINTVDSKGPDMHKPTVMVPLKDHVKASYSNGDLKKKSFVGRDNIVNTFYTPPIHIKQNMKSMAGLSSVDTGLLSGLGDMGSNLAKGVALLTMQNILKIDGDGKTSLKSVFSPDKQKVAEAALQSYKSRAASIASSKGWSAGEISKKNKESVDLYIKEIEPLIDSTDEKKAFNDILLSSSSSLTEKLMPVDPTLLTPTPTGASTTALAEALKTAVIEGMKASAPLGGTPAPTVKTEPEEEEEEEDEEDEPDAKINIKVVPNITQDEVNETLQAMLKDGKGSSDVRTLNIATLGDIIVYAKLNETKEFKEFFQKRDTSKVVNKNKLKMVAAMTADGELNKILTNIAIGNIMKNGTTTQCWKQIRDNGVDFIAAYQAQATTPQAAASTQSPPNLTPQTTPQPSAPASPNLGPLPDPNIPPLSPTPATPGGNGRKRKKNTQNKAQVHLSEIAKILQKYR